MSAERDEFWDLKTEMDSVLAMDDDEILELMVGTAIELIRRGRLDDHAELLLAELHDRKRERHKVRGFPRC